MSSVNSLQNSLVNIIPFYIPEGEKISVDFSKEEIIFRSVILEKKEFPAPLFFNGKLVEDKVFYWQPTVMTNEFVSKGIELTKKGIK